MRRAMILQPNRQYTNAGDEACVAGPHGRDDDAAEGKRTTRRLPSSYYGTTFATPSPKGYHP